MHRPIHFELGVKDPQRAIEFYTKVFGWRVQTWEGPQKYWLVQTGQDSEPGINGGLLQHKDMAARTVNTIGVQSVEEACARVVAAGGQVAMPKFAIPGIGYQAYCLDTEGILFGVHQPDPGAA